jgi:hypothetical protein
MKTIYLKNSDGEAEKIEFYEIENKTEILNELFKKYQNITGNLKFNLVVDEDGDCLYESGCRYY